MEYENEEDYEARYEAEIERLQMLADQLDCSIVEARLRERMGATTPAWEGGLLCLGPREVK